MKLRNLLMTMYEDVIAGNISSILIRDNKCNLFLVDEGTDRQMLMKYLNEYGRLNVKELVRDDMNCKYYNVTASRM